MSPLTFYYAEGYNAAKRGDNIWDIPSGLDDMQRNSWETGFRSYKHDKQVTL